MGKIVKLKNANNENTYPITKTEAIYLEDNKTTLKDYLDAISITQTAGPAQIVTFNDGAKNIPIKNLVINIVPTQIGIGDPSPDNVRAISGYTGVTVARTSKNLLPVTGNTTTRGGITYTYNDDGSVTATGTATGNTTSNYGHVTLPAGTYLLSGCTGGSTTMYRIRLGNGSYSGAVVAQNYDDDTEFTLEEATDVYARIYVGVAAGVNVNITFKPMVRRASATDSTYEPYVGATYPITFPTAAGTVYGGTLIINLDGSGTLTLNYGSMTYDGTEPWVAYSTHGYHITNSEMMRGTWWNDKYTLCNEFTKVADNSVLGIRPGVNNQEIYVVAVNGNLANVTNLATWKTWLASNPLTVTYPLTTPATYTLSAIQVIQILQGVNNIWTDITGTLQITYKADLATYIFNIISSLNS